MMVFHSMKVLQLISSSYGYYGAERVCVTLATELEKMGVGSVVCAFRNTHKADHLEVLEHAKQSGLITEEITCRGRFDWKAVEMLRDVVQRHKIDIVHCHNIKPNLYTRIAIRGSGVPILSTCHSWHTGTLRGWLISILDRLILLRFDRVVLVSEHMQRQIRRFGLAGDIIYNGIDLEPFMVRSSGLREEMEWSDRLVIGLIGRLSAEKGQKYFLQAAVAVLEDFPNALFLIVGDGPDRRSLEVEAKLLGIGESVRFLGVRNDIPDILSSLDVLVMPSLIEGMPMALLEAMASGRAVVASKVGSIPAVVQSRVNGILVPPADATTLACELRSLLTERGLRESLGRRAAETVANGFSSSSMASKYLRLYFNMMAA